MLFYHRALKLHLIQCVLLWWYANNFQIFDKSSQCEFIAYYILKFTTTRNIISQKL